MKISVIIPTYQPKDYLWECLNSLTSQTISKDDYEVIIVLNGCDEPYKSQIQSYIDAKEGFHFSLIQTDVPGVSNARNIGLDKSKGEYISFIDDDPWVFTKSVDMRASRPRPSADFLGDVISFRSFSIFPVPEPDSSWHPWSQRHTGWRAGHNLEPHSV